MIKFENAKVTHKQFSYIRILLSSLTCQLKTELPKFLNFQSLNFSRFLALKAVYLIIYNFGKEFAEFQVMTSLGISIHRFQNLVLIPPFRIPKWEYYEPRDNTLSPSNNLICRLWVFMKVLLSLLWGKTWNRHRHTNFDMGGGRL